MIRVVVADDEVLARQKLRKLLEIEPDLEVAGECATASEAIEVVRLARPEMLFLDIRMPGMDGFEVVERLGGTEGLRMPRVIFTTAYDRYALRAFEIHAADYLLKPFTRERLRAAVDRVREQLMARPLVPNAHPRSDDGRYMSRIVFKSRGRILFLPVAEIRWIGAEENYIRVATGSETHLLRETMARIEEQLDPSMFLRVHRSAIVNLQFVKEVRTEPGGEYSVLLANGQKIGMSRSYRSRVSDLLVRS